MNAHPSSLSDREQALKEANAKLAGALDMIRESLTGGNVDDLLYIINEALRFHRVANEGSHHG